MRRLERRSTSVLVALAILAFVVALPVAAAVPVSASEPPGANAEQSVIVSLDPDAAPLTRVSLMAHGAEAATTRVVLEGGAGYAATLSPGAIEALRRTRGILAVTPNRVLEPHAAPLDQNGALAAWDAGWRGDGQAIVVIDTGVDASNPNLVGKVTDEACFTPARGTGGDCPDGSMSQTGPGTAAPCTGRTDCSHGTHVASTAAANGPAVYGTAPNASVVAIRVFSSVADPSERIVTDEASIIRALAWVDQIRATQPVASVNMSFGGAPITTPCDASPALRSSIDRLTAAGIAIVASAGNDASTSMVSFPACVPNVLSVGAEGRAGIASPFTNLAPTLGFFAPAEGVEGAWSSPCCTRTLSGTSFAAPQIAAAFALLRQQLGAGAVAPRAELLRRTGEPVYAAASGTWSQTNSLRVGWALDPQYQAASPAMLQRAASPIGSVDALRVDPDGVHLSGWVLDPDTVAPATVHVYVDGVFAATTVASRPRPDVAAAYPGYGYTRGFTASVAVPPGDHTVCAYALDIGAGEGNVLIACGRAAFGGAVGAIDSAVGAAGVVTMAGWAIDTTRSLSVDVEMTIDDVVVARGPAADPRPDVGEAYPGYGAAHGYALAAPAGPGSYRVCVRVAASPAGSSRPVGCRDVDVPGGAPFGVLDDVRAGAGTITAQGWAIDPDTVQPIDVVVRVDGVAMLTTPARQPRVDLLAGVPGYGAAHGFAITVAVLPGPRRVCVDAVDDATGSLGTLGCIDLDVR